MVLGEPDVAESVADEVVRPAPRRIRAGIVACDRYGKLDERGGKRVWRTLTTAAAHGASNKKEERRQYSHGYLVRMVFTMFDGRLSIPGICAGNQWLRLEHRIYPNYPCLGDNSVNRMIAIVMTLFLTIALGCGKSKVEAPSANDVTEFHNAVQEGDATIVERLLSAKPNLVNAPNERGETPLKVAKQKNNDELADVITKHGGHE
jgi:hypothetical protein